MSRRTPGRSVRHHADVDDGWLTVQQAADACGMAYRTMLGMVSRGDLPAEKPDGTPYRLRRTDVAAFIERSRVQRFSSPLCRRASA